jgi:hypothetical protein
MMRRPGRDETFLGRIRLRSPRLSGGATFKTQRQLVAESLVFDRCRNERGSSTAITSAAIPSSNFDSTLRISLLLPVGTW